MHCLVIGGNYLPITARSCERGRIGGGGGGGGGGRGDGRWGGGKDGKGKGRVMKLMRRMKGNLGGNRKKFASHVWRDFWCGKKKNTFNKLCAKWNDRTFVSLYYSDPSTLSYFLSRLGVSDLVINTLYLQWFEQKSTLLVDEVLVGI